MASQALSRSQSFASIAEVGSLPKDDVAYLVEQDNSDLVNTHVGTLYSTFIGTPDATRTQDVSRSFFARQDSGQLRAFRKGLKNIKALASGESTAKALNAEDPKAQERIIDSLKFIFDMSRYEPPQSPSVNTSKQQLVSVVGQGGSEPSSLLVRMSDGSIRREQDLMNQLGITEQSAMIARAMRDRQSVTVQGNTVTEKDGTQTEITERKTKS